MDSNRTRQPQVGDFIKIWAWHTIGQVTAVRPSDLGSDDALIMKVQDRADGIEVRYRLEPGEYTILLGD